MSWPCYFLACDKGENVWCRKQLNSSSWLGREEKTQNSGAPLQGHTPSGPLYSCHHLPGMFHIQTAVCGLPLGKQEQAWPWRCMPLIPVVRRLRWEGPVSHCCNKCLAKSASEGRVCLASRFEDTVHHAREGAGMGVWGTGSHCVCSQGAQGEGCCCSASILPFVWQLTSLSTSFNLIYIDHPSLCARHLSPGWLFLTWTNRPLRVSSDFHSAKKLFRWGSRYVSSHYFQKGENKNKKTLHILFCL